MKLWTRAIMAILLAALAISYLVTVPAEAAKTETVVTYRGYTLSWSEPDASDLRIVRTPGAAESFPAQASDRSIDKAKARVASASERQASEDPTDSCNFVPDSFGLANFAPACDAHDVCYGSSADRLTCDLLFLAQLQAACNVYPAGSPLRLTCNTIASIYFVGVRLFGAPFYIADGGTGNPA
jgi:hypothetical protein